MYGRNIHNFRAHSCFGYTALVCNYTFCFLSCCLVLGGVIPYHLAFMPKLRAACWAGDASWLYYYLCGAINLFVSSVIFISFFKAVLTPPGFVPREPWCHTPTHDGQVSSLNTHEVIDRDTQGKLRYCGKCEQYKPDKAHHCSVCGRCIFRMDHHCPWINNCVGRDNLKYFLLFITYIPLQALHNLLTVTYSLMNHIHSMSFDTSELEGVAAVFTVVLVLFSFCITVFFAFFSLYFLRMAYKGETSISQFIATKVGETGSKTRRATLAAREMYMLDVFGVDRRWWKTVLPFTPQRTRRDVTMSAAMAASSNEVTKSFLENLI